MVQKGKKWIVVKEFQGTPKEDDLKLVEFDLPEQLKENEVLLQAVYLSVDPYMRLFPKTLGEPMIGEQLSEVIKTRNGQWPLGSLVLAKAGWQSHYVSNGTNIPLTPIRFDIGRTPLSYTLGILGMPGATAYISLEKCSPKPNETILISTAAGAVGHVLGQLAKFRGLKVIGLTGSDEKVKWLNEIGGFDHVLNYKKVNYSQELTKIAPDGVDIYYDMVGGDYYHNIINNHMKKHGRILVCGSIENYNDVDQKLYKATNISILVKELTVIGFMCFTYDAEWPNAFAEMNKLIQKGKLKTRETHFHGIEKMRDAFFSIFTGDGIGKNVIKAINETTHYP